MTHDERSVSCPPEELVQRILSQLTPLMVGQRRLMARHGCMRVMSSTHLHVLMLLEGEGPLSMGRLAEALDISMPNATGLVGRMEERGLVERVHDAQDRRRVEVRITDAGRAAIDEMDVVRRQHLAWLIAQMRPDQQERALAAFRDLRETAERLEREHGAAPGPASGWPGIDHPHTHPHGSRRTPAATSR